MTPAQKAKLTKWFNSLPCESIGKEHWDALIAIFKK